MTGWVDAGMKKERESRSPLSAEVLLPQGRIIPLARGSGQTRPQWSEVSGVCVSGKSHGLSLMLQPSCSLLFTDPFSVLDKSLLGDS